MPPVHPALVHYPIALVTLSVLADVIGFIVGSQSLQDAGWWALLGAALGAALTVIAGLFDMAREKIEPAAHRRVHTHMKVGLILFAVLAGLTIWRWLIYSSLAHSIGGIYLVSACLVLGLTFFQGWLGGELVFTDGVGVAPTGQGTEPPQPQKHEQESTGGTSLEHGSH